MAVARGAVSPRMGYVCGVCFVRQQLSSVDQRGALYFRQWCRRGMRKLLAIPWCGVFLAQDASALFAVLSISPAEVGAYR